MKLTRKYKNNRNPISKICIFVFLMGMFASCKKFVEIPPPKSQLVDATVFNNDATATAAQIAVYNQLYSNKLSWAISMYTGLQGDELITYGNTPDLVNAYQNTLSSNNSAGFPWNPLYNIIYQSNSILEGIQHYGQKLSAATQKQLIGESKFIRAFCYFYLVNYYGNLPLVVTTDYASNQNLSRTDKALVYAQIISDLQSAKSFLNINYVNTDNTTVTTQKVRPNKAAAAALLTRAFLYAGKTDSAVVEANYVIDNSNYALCTSLYDVFLANSSETILQIMTPTGVNTYNNTIDGQSYILQSPPGGPGYSAISSNLVNAFETNDQRFNSWIGTYTDPSSGTLYYFPYKYKSYNTVDNSEYTMAIRLAEVYLIRAEAKARLNDLTGATEDLDLIRNRAGLPNTTATTQEDLLAAILHERQVELFTEWGNRWFDMQRFDVINSIMGSPGNVCQAKGGTWSPNWVLWPIPQTERLADPNLTQNSGY